MLTDLAHPRAWWKSAIVYQIYPISFFDSNGDGIGDLNGIHQKLDYLKDLGVNIIWLSPIYRSPLADMGYDISDYRDIDPRYGTLEDWDNLLKGIHERNMKLIMDLVVNHSSDEHDWFKQSRSSKTNPKRDWYIWRPPKYDSEGNRHPPNNWKSVFEGSTWEYDEVTGEYYLHLFVSKQPDLNWENPEVHKAVYDMMRFWLDRGCDGFRMDVINILSKTPGLPDAPVTEPGQKYQDARIYYAEGPRIHEFIQEMNQKVLSHYDIVAVGETPFTHDINKLDRYVLPANKELEMVFTFDLMVVDQIPGDSPLQPKKWKLVNMKDVVERWQTHKRDQGFWNAVFIENHDHARSVSRFGNDSEEWRSLSAKLLAILQITQTGTLYVFQGQELGLKNFPRSWGIEEYKDVKSRNLWNKVLEERKRNTPGEDVDMTDVLDYLSRQARDHSRTPMQWDDGPSAGFTTGTPWMRINDDYKTWNAKNQLMNDSSVLAFWKQAIGLRKGIDVFTYGEFKLIARDDNKIFAYTMTLEAAEALVVLNFSTDTVSFPLDHFFLRAGYEEFVLVLSNYPIRDARSPRLLLSAALTLRPYEGQVYLKNGTNN